MKASLASAGALFALTILLSSPTAQAAKNRQGGHGEAQPTTKVAFTSGQYGQFHSTKVNLFLTDDLKIEDLTHYNYTLKLLKELERVLRTTKSGEFSADPTAFREKVGAILKERRFSESSTASLESILDGLRRPSLNNAVVLGRPGVGKSFLLDQLIAMISFGIIPDYLQSATGKSDNDHSPILAAFAKKFIEKTQFIRINQTLLAKDPTPSGEAWASADMREKSVLDGLFQAAKQDFQDHGIRTVFLMEEIGVFRFKPDLIEQLKEILDPTGFGFGDPLTEARDPGYSVIGITTPEEWRELINRDLALNRRFKPVYVSEPTEQEALQILKKEAAVWVKTNGDQIVFPVKVLESVIAMRKFRPDPSLAMPDSVLKLASDLFQWGVKNPRVQALGRLTIEDAWEFLVQQAHLPKELWAPSNGGLPLMDLPKLVKQRVKGHDKLIDKISAILQSAVLDGFRRVPVILLGGPTGSGKDTLARAFNEILFGHDGRAINFHLNDRTFQSKMEKNHDGGLPEIIERLDEVHHGMILLNEGKNLSAANYEKLKLLTEEGIISPTGGDRLQRFLGINAVIIAGEWGQELFAGKTDEEAQQIHETLDESDIRSIFLKGHDGNLGAVPRSVIDRATLTGGLFIMRPVPKFLYGDIVRAAVAKIQAGLRTKRGIQFEIDETLVTEVVETSVQLRRGTRGLEALTSDFTQHAILAAGRRGLPAWNISLQLSMSEDRKSVLLRDVTPLREGAPKRASEYLLPLGEILRTQCGSLLK